MSLPVRIRCPYLEQSNDIKRLGESDVINRNCLAELNSALASAATEVAHDMGVYSSAELHINSLPEIGETFVIGTETWSFVAARAAAFQITRGAAVHTAITNAVAAINLDTTQDIVASIDLDADNIVVQHADTSGGAPIPGPWRAALSETLGDVLSIWDQADLGDTGTLNMLYQSHCQIVATAVTTTAPFRLRTAFVPLDVRFRIVDATGLPLPSRTATAVALGDFVAIDFSAGGDPCQAGEVMLLDIYGTSLV